MAVALALLSSLAFGVSDYIGGRTSRHARPVTVAMWAEVMLFVVMVVAIPLAEPAGPSAAAIWWGAAAGVFGSVGVLGLYAALSSGNMTVVAPITGVVAAALPVVVGVVLGERPGIAVFVGIVIAMLAVALIGGAVGAVHQPAPIGTIMLAFFVGSAFGMLFVAYSRAGEDSGLWPLLTSRFAALPLLGIAAIVMAPAGERLPRERRTMVPALTIGALIGVANWLFLLATHRGLLSVVAVLVALYPAATIVLASLLDGERVSRWQLLGMVAAAVGVALITVAS